ncbi:MAG: gamma-glutamyltransferase, partial [Hyphomicrobiaceae bacterium]
MNKAALRPEQTSGITSCRPVISARRHVVSAGHYLAAHAGFAILEAGGNAIDAGVAAGIALGVLQSDLVNVAGVAPIILYHAQSRKVFTVSGLGPWPKLVTPDYFMKRHGGKIPRGLLRTVVPAAPDAWIQALQRWGSMSFGDVAAASVRFAKEGFAAHPLLCETITTHRREYEEWPSNQAIYLPNGRPPRVGEIFVQTDLAKSLQYMIDQERAAAPKGRDAGLEAARSAFYTGDIGRAIVAYHEQNGGLLRMDDLAVFGSAIEASVSVRFGDFSVHTCGPWCQGPVLAQMLRLVEATGCHKHPHNSFA